MLSWVHLIRNRISGWLLANKLERPKLIQSHRLEADVQVNKLGLASRSISSWRVDPQYSDWDQHGEAGDWLSIVNIDQTCWIAAKTKSNPLKAECKMVHFGLQNGISSRFQKKLTCWRRASRRSHGPRIQLLWSFQHVWSNRIRQSPLTAPKRTRKECAKTSRTTRPVRTLSSSRSRKVYSAPTKLTTEPNNSRKVNIPSSQNTGPWKLVYGI